MKTSNNDRALRDEGATVTEKDSIEQPPNRDEADMIRMGKTQQTGVSNLPCKRHSY